MLFLTHGVHTTVSVERIKFKWSVVIASADERHDLLFREQSTESGLIAEILLHAIITRQS